MRQSKRLATLVLLLGATVPTASPGQFSPAVQPPGIPVDATTKPAPQVSVTDLTASRITMSMRDATLDELVAELSRQSATTVRVTEPPGVTGRRWPKVVYSVDLKDQSFWPALQAICDATGTTYELQSPFGGPPGIYVQPNRSAPAWGAKPVAASGPAALTVQGVQRGGVVNVGNYNDVDRSITIALLGQVEPKFAPIRGPLTIRITRAVDDAGAALAHLPDASTPPNAATDPEMNPQPTPNPGIERGMAQPAIVRLADPTGTSRRIAVLAGSATFRVSSKVARLAVDDLANMGATPMQFREQLLVLARPRVSGDQWSVPLTIFRNGGTDAAWQSLQRAMQSGSIGSLRLLDAKGRAWQASGVNNTGHGDAENRIELQVPFRRERTFPYARDGEPAPGAPTRLEWEMPVESSDVTIDFEFTDINLP